MAILLILVSQYNFISYLINTQTAIFNMPFFSQVNIVFSKESLTEADGENIVNNLAAFLGIPNDKIRLIEVVPVNSNNNSLSQLTTVVVSHEVMMLYNIVY